MKSILFAIFLIAMLWAGLYGLQPFQLQKPKRVRRTARVAARQR